MHCGHSDPDHTFGSIFYKEGSLEGKEYTYWLPIDQLAEYKEFPMFFREKLANLGKEIEHIVSDERAAAKF